ncbi:MAG: hypothetical protein IJW59_03435 [Clostridia bacterium]|nr:hypothetical protein [Clostridia bacterium]
MKKTEKTFDLNNLSIGFIQDDYSPSLAGYKFLIPASKYITRQANIMLLKDAYDEHNTYSCYHPALNNLEILVDEYQSDDLSKKLSNTTTWQAFKFKYFTQLENIIPQQNILSYQQLHDLEFSINDELRRIKGQEYVDDLNKKLEEYSIN